MPSSYTSSLRLTLPATGELGGQWGNTVNTGITELLDAAVAGTAAISTWGGAGIAYTLSNNSGLADEARKMFIVATGSPGEAKNVICPAVSKFYVLRNDTTGGFALTLKTPSGVGISVPAGQYKFLYCDGTDVVEMFNSAGALTLGGALSVGGTATFAANPTLSAGTANQVQYLNGSKVLVGSPNMTFNGTDLTVSGAVNAGSVNATTLDLTNLEVTNIKAKDGTASASIADTTGVMSLVANPVLSGGTANGVLYLNGSKVATSGSALTFDGTSFTSSASSGGNVNALIAVNSSTAVTDGKTISVLLRGSDTSGTLKDAVALRAVPTSETYANANLVFLTRSGDTLSEQMRLTSTGLGIGTSSPSSKLNVDGTTAISWAGGGISLGLVTLGTQGTGGSLFVNTPSLNSSFASGLGVDGSYSGGASTVNIKAYGVNSGGPYGSNLAFFTSSTTSLTERMRLDASGNLGIGTSSPGAKLDVQTSGVGIQLKQNAAGSATYYIMDTTVETGGKRWRFGYTGGLGAAASTFSLFNQTDNITSWVADSSGNLGLGVTPSAWGTSAFQTKVASVWGFSNNAYVGCNYYFDGTDRRYIATAAASEYAQFNGQHTWYTAPSGTAGNAISFTQAMTLDASGQLLLGGTSLDNPQSWGRIAQIINSGDNGAAISVKDSNNEYNIATYNGALLFADGLSERARITSGGYFKASNDGIYIGSGGSYHELRSTTSSTSTVLITHASATDPVGARIYYSAATPNGTGNFFLYCDDNTALRASIRSNGGIANYSANDVNLSDRREKTNFAPAKSYLDTICAIPVQTFEYIDQSEDDPGLTLGVVAQDVQAIAPELVMESNWGTADEPKQRLSIYQTDLQYALMKCVQELKAELDATKARLAALESN